MTSPPSSALSGETPTHSATIAVAAVGRYRWIICGLIFFATTINYLDRAVISLLKPFLAAEFNWSPAEEAGHYADIEIAFKLAYAIGMLFAGRVIDRLGTKLGYALATGLWSLAAVAHALVSSVAGFGFVRVLLGITEAGNFPAAIRTTAEWFPKKERAFATGIFNSGSNIGAIIAPLSVPFIAVTLGWRWAFVITGAVGFIWLILWYLFYEIPAKQSRLQKSEFDYIHSDKEEPAHNTGTAKTSWWHLLKFRQTWAFAIGKFLTDPIWWFYLFWLPDFLKKQYHITGTDIAMPVAAVYVISSFGSIGGGYLPMLLVNRGISIFNARRFSMLVYAIAVMPIILAQWLGQLHMWFAIGIIGLAAAAHQAWSANIFTLVSDMFPKKVTASVTGIGGMAGGMGGILLSLLVQKQMFVYYESIGQIQTGYYIMFFICGGAYISAWLIMQWLVPKVKPVVLP